MINNNETTELKNTIIESLLDKKGKDIRVLDLRQLTQSVADYFIICHGNSTTQVDALANNIEHQTRTILKQHVIHKEGNENSQWILLDYGDIVVHVFIENIRRFYNLEELWGDAEIDYIKE